MAEIIAPKGRLDLAAVTSLHRQLSALSGQDVIVDLREVTQLGALCLQALVSAAKSADAAGVSFEVNGANERVTDHVTAMGNPLPAFCGVAA